MKVSSQQLLEKITKDGYAIAPAIFNGQQVAAMLNDVKSLDERYNYEAINATPRLDQGQQTIYNLQNKSLSIAQHLLKEPIIKQVLMGTLNDKWHKAIDLNKPNYILRSFSARNNITAAPMHIDSMIPYQGDHPLSMQVIIILEDQTVENGCSVVVPGTHQSGDYVKPSDREKSIPLETKAGDVVFWDSRIWHGTGDNHTGKSRWSLIATFVRWWVKQGYQITEAFPEDYYQQISDEEKAVLGFCSVPFHDEAEGIDFKVGYNDLKPTVADYNKPS